MVDIFVEPIGIKIKSKNNETIHKSLKKAGIEIEAPCGGNGICGKCRFLAIEINKIEPTQHQNISYEDTLKGVRLACMAIAESDTSIRLESGYAYNGEKNSETQKDKILSAGFSFEENLNIIGKNYGIYNPTNLGLAIDIGTTTIVVAIVSLKHRKVLSSASSLNPQIIHGHDVLSRINYSSTPNKLFEMASLVRDKIDELVEKACQKTALKNINLKNHVDSENIAVTKDNIVEVTIGANTTMLEIAALIDPTPLGHLPFKRDIEGGKIFSTSKFGLKVNKNARVYLPPVLHAFVGSDISAGLLRCPEFFDNSKSVLYLDMGTNGEICLNINGRRFTTSTAAGPAFEGVGISSGMRAAKGAVERVDVVDEKFIFYIIGQDKFIVNISNQSSNNINNKIKGICGSGIVDLIAALLTTKHLDKSGKLQFESQFCYGNNIYLTQKDIRQIQLAKSAVRTGIDLMLEKGGINYKELDKIYIAGGFGNFLNPKSMEIIGLLPKGSFDKILFCGNACIDGSIMLLIEPDSRNFLESFLYDIEHIQLAGMPQFMESFIKNLNFK